MQIDSKGIAIRYLGGKCNTGPLRGRLLYTTGGFRYFLKQGNIYIRVEANLKPSSLSTPRTNWNFSTLLGLDHTNTGPPKLQRNQFDIGRNAATDLKSPSDEDRHKYSVGSATKTRQQNCRPTLSTTFSRLSRFTHPGFQTRPDLARAGLQLRNCAR